MQLGTRWSLGGKIPSQLPDTVELAVRAVEDDLATQDVDTGDWRWTLTWLESQPVLELDDGTIIEYDPDADEATITEPELSDDDLFDDDDDDDLDDDDDDDGDDDLEDRDEDYGDKFD